MMSDSICEAQLCYKKDSNKNECSLTYPFKMLKDDASSYVAQIDLIEHNSLKMLIVFTKVNRHNGELMFRAFK